MSEDPPPSEKMSAAGPAPGHDPPAYSAPGPNQGYNPAQPALPAGYYPPQPQPGYYPPPQPQPIFMMAPPQQQQQQQQSSVVVVNAGQPSNNTTVIREKRGVNHCLHCIITVIFWPWIIVWIILCLTD